MALSTYAANAILSHLIGKAALPLPTIYVGMFTASPTTTGSQVNEAAYTGYARLAAPAAAWAVSAAGAETNASQFTFGTRTNTGADPVLTHWATFDAATGGNIIEFGALTTAKTVTNGDAPFVPAGSFNRTAA